MDSFISHRRLLFVAGFLSCATAHTTYYFTRGSTRQITFEYKLSSKNVEPYVTIRLVNKFIQTDPFYKNGTVDETKLLPSQRGRFSGALSSHETDLKAIVVIREVSETDQGHYKASFFEDRQEKIIIEAIVNVTVPKSEVHCKVNVNPEVIDAPDSSIAVFHCYTPTGSNETVIIVCRQDAKIVPSSTHSAHDKEVSAVFHFHLKDEESQVECCAVTEIAEAEHNPCANFSYTLPARSSPATTEDESIKKESTSCSSGVDSDVGKGKSILVLNYTTKSRRKLLIYGIPCFISIHVRLD